MRISDWSSDVCSSDLLMLAAAVVNDADELFVRQQRAAQQHRLGDVELIVGQRDQQGARRRRIARQAVGQALADRNFELVDQLVENVEDQVALLIDRKSTRLNSSH